MDELATELKALIRATGKRKVPAQPAVVVPARKPLPALGTLSRDMTVLDAQQGAAEAALLSQARKVRSGREAAGVGDRYAERQSPVRPTLAQLVGKRVDVCCNYDLKEGGTELRWSQGLVLYVSDGTNIPKPPPAVTALFKMDEAIMIRWDANEKRNELEKDIPWRLLPSRWSPKRAHTSTGSRGSSRVAHGRECARPTPCD